MPLLRRCTLQERTAATRNATCNVAGVAGPHETHVHPFVPRESPVATPATHPFASRSFRCFETACLVTSSPRASIVARRTSFVVRASVALLRCSSIAFRTFETCWTLIWTFPSTVISRTRLSESISIETSSASDASR